MQFNNPLAFLLLLAVPALIAAGRFFKGKAGITFSSANKIKGLERSVKQRFALLPDILRLLALILLIVAIARPQMGREYIRDISKGVAIELVVDRSGSMAAEMQFSSKRFDRLEVVKRVIDEFVHGNGGELEGRPNDLIGMVSFARYADTVCPLTLSHGALSGILDNIDIVARKEEDGTSIGDALALAAARLRTAEEALVEQKQGARDETSYEIKSKIIILLTDGQNNFGKRSPGQAAKLAAEWGIKIYSIGIGGDDAYSTLKTTFGDYKIPVGQAVDERTLVMVAEETGGFYRRAGDADSLRSVYSEIDDMEKSEIESIRYLDYKELFMPFALAALLLIALELFLRNTLFRRVP